MRPITQIFLLLVIAVAVYVLWPRSPQLDKFEPAKIGALEVSAWIAAREGKSLGATTDLYKVYDTQLKFSPIASMMIGMSEARALATLERLAPDKPQEEREILKALQEKYAIIKRDTKRDFNSDEVARTDLAWMAIMRDGGTPEQIIPIMTQSLATIYGGTPEEYTSVAEGFAWARVLVLGTHVPEDITDPKQAAEQSAIAGYEALKSLLTAETPGA